MHTYVNHVHHYCSFDNFPQGFSQVRHTVSSVKFLRLIQNSEIVLNFLASKDRRQASVGRDRNSCFFFLPS